MFSWPSPSLRGVPFLIFVLEGRIPSSRKTGRRAAVTTVELFPPLLRLKLKISRKFSAEEGELETFSYYISPAFEVRLGSIFHGG